PGWARPPPIARRLHSRRALPRGARARARTRGCRGGLRPPAAGSLRSAGAEFGHWARAFHLHRAAGRSVIHLRARVHFGDAVVVSRIATGPAPPHARGLGALTAC